MFVDILPDFGDDDGTAVLNFFVEMDDDGLLILGGEPEAGTMTIGAANTAGDIRKVSKEEVLAGINEVLDDIRSYMDIGEGTVEVSETEDIDWLNNWKNFFHSFEVDDILVIPSRMFPKEIRISLFFISIPAPLSEPECMIRHSSASGISESM